MRINYGSKLKIIERSELKPILNFTVQRNLVTKFKYIIHVNSVMQLLT